MRRAAAFVLLGLVLVASLAWLARTPPSRPAAILPESRLAERADELARPEPASAAAAEARRAPLVQPLGGPATAAARFPVERERAGLVLEVQDAEGRAADGALLELRAHTGPRPELYPLSDGRELERDARADEAGRARFEQLRCGPYEVRARSADGVRHAERRFVLEAPQTRLLLRLEGRAPPRELVVRVVDERGAPVPGALVELTGGTGDLRVGRGGSERTLVATSDDAGRARFEEPGFHGFVAVATAPDGRAGSATVWTRARVLGAAQRGLELVVSAPARLEGALVGLAPEALQEARVLARLLNNAHPYYTTHGRAFEARVEGGRYAFDALAPGTYTLSLADPRGARLALPQMSFGSAALENSLDPLEVELAPGASVVQDLRVTIGGAIEGHVRDERGAPLANALVLATFAPRTSNFPDGFVLHGVHVWRYDSESGGGDGHPETHRRAATDARGVYRLVGLPPGLHRVELALPGRVHERREEVRVRDGETTLLEHALAPAGAIQGVARDGGYLGVIRAGGDAPRAIAILPDGGDFCFPGLEAGAWIVARFHSFPEVEPVPLVEVEVEAGRTTWVDVDAEAELPVRVAGVVLEDGAPVAGARVRYARSVSETDEAGRFEHRAAFPPNELLFFDVEREGLVARFELRGLEPGPRGWECTLELGPHALGLRAEDADGRPTSATLRLELDVAQPEALRHVRAEELALAAEGRVLRGLPAGELRVSARFADGALALGSISIPAEEALVLRAPPAGTLEVLVTDEAGRPLAERWVDAIIWTGDGPAPADEAAFRERASFRSEHTDERGHALFAGLTAGDVLVELRPRGGWLSLEGGDAPPVRSRLPLDRGQRRSLTLVERAR